METKNFIKRYAKLLILFICIICFISLIEDVFDKDIMMMDTTGYNFISAHFISDFATPIAKFVTNFGGGIILIIISTISIIVLKNKKISLSIWINLIVSAVLNFILKNILQRPRPTEFRIIDEGGYSFPSGHSMVSMAFYGFIIYLVYKNIDNKYIKWSIITILSLLIITIGISRIYLGVHYTSDVIAGFLVAISYLIIYTGFVKKYVLEK